MFKRIILPVLITTIWVSISEFLRNEILFKTYWTDHYSRLGMIFPSEPVNGAVWGIWSLAFAVFTFILSKKFNLVSTTLLSWFAGFVLMWLVIGNMGVLPHGLLVFAVPLSLLESFVAAFICNSFTKTKHEFRRS